jgi:hypothetical protein
MCSYLLSRPSRMGLCVVVAAPVDGDILVICSVIMVGRSACRLFARAFLLVVRTPNFGHGLLVHAVIRSFGGWWFGPWASFQGKPFGVLLSMCLHRECPKRCSLLFHF